MKQIIILTKKDLALLFKDKTSLVVTFALPIVLVAIVGSAFANAFPPSIGITSHDYAFSKVMFWGLMGGVASSVTSIAIEKSSGTIVRLQLAPINKLHMLLGKALACMVVILASSFLTWTISAGVFGIKTTAPFSLLIVCVASAVFFAGLSTFLSNFVKTERAAGALSWGILQVMACFSGIMFPTTVMPGWMLNITKFNPLTWAVRAMESALWKGGAFMDLYMPITIIVGAGIVLFLASLYRFRWTS
jgi:ABC-2 type transport system permease protein